MKFEEAIVSIEKFGFDWSLFQNYFRFGDVILREGNYQKLLIVSLESLKDFKDRVRLIALLDMQAAVFLEQVWVMNEQFEAEKEVDPSPSHLALAWIQINENLSREFKLPRRNVASLMFELGLNDTLADRLFV